MSELLLLLLLFLVCAAASSPRTASRRRWLRMDDELARAGIKVELTTREEYMERRFTRLSQSQHDLTPMLASEITEWLNKKKKSDIAVNSGMGRKGLYVASIGGLPIFSSGDRVDAECSATQLIFSSPCDEEHVDIRANGDVFCRRSGTRVASLGASVEGRRFRVSVAEGTLKFHPLEVPFPLESQPESYWGSEDQYTMMRQIGGL